MTVKVLHIDEEECSLKILDNVWVEYRAHVVFNIYTSVK